MTRSGSPAVASSRPSASATATTPRCRLSTNPDRSTSARTSTPPPRAPALEPRGYQGRSAVSGSQQEPRLVGDPPSPFRRHARVDGYRRDHLLFQAVEASGAADTVRQELVELLSHRVTIDHQPSIDLLVNGKLVTTAQMASAKQLPRLRNRGRQAVHGPGVQ